MDERTVLSQTSIVTDAITREKLKKLSYKAEMSRSEWIRRIVATEFAKQFEANV
jgi:hypothetical protein